MTAACELFYRKFEETGFYKCLIVKGAFSEPNSDWHPKYGKGSGIKGILVRLVVSIVVIFIKRLIISVFFRFLVYEQQTM